MQWHDPFVSVLSPWGNWQVDVRTHHVATNRGERVRRRVKEDFPDVRHITLVMNNPLNPHAGASLCKTFASYKARRLPDKLEWGVSPQPILS